MNALWAYFWPCFVAGLLVGAIVGRVTFRRRIGREIRLFGGLAVALVLALIWHGPLGGADGYGAKVEQEIHQALVDNEMTQVTAHLHHGPLTRRVMLSGPADDFQQNGLVELMDSLPGVESATWGAGAGTPLILEALGVAPVGYLFGLLLAYLVELRRRYNTQWNW